MSRFFFPDRELLAASGYAGIASMPVLFDRGYRILEAENLYLLDRATRKWPIRKGGAYRPKDGSLALTTIAAIGRHIHHFADWRLERSLRSSHPLEDLTFDDVMDYEREQWLGQGGYEGRSISPRTAAVRADVAADFLRWAADRGLRRPLERKRRSALSRIATTKAQPRFRASTKGLTQIPDRTEIRAWLDAVGKQRGLPKYLICRTMCETGIRLMEAVALDVDQWPSLADVFRARASGKIEMDLFLVVTKNSTARTVKLPMALAITVAHWVVNEDRGGRRALQAMAVLRDGEEGRSDRLFVSDRPGSEGIPIQRHTVFDCFHEVEPRPKGWHPHMARHAFACHFMIGRLLVQADRTKSGVERWIEHGGVVAADILRQLLGHKSLETTRIYLNYLRLNANVAMLSEEFHDLMNGEPDAVA